MLNRGLSAPQLRLNRVLIQPQQSLLIAPCQSLTVMDPYQSLIASQQRLHRGLLGPQQILKNAFIEPKQSLLILSLKLVSIAHSCPRMPDHCHVINPPNKQKEKRHIQQYEDTYSSLRTQLYKSKFSDIQRKLKRKRKKTQQYEDTQTHTQISPEYIYIYIYRYIYTFVCNIHIYIYIHVHKYGLNRAEPLNSA